MEMLQEVQMMSEALLTVKEVAERLKCHPHTVRRWIWSERIHAIKLGDLVRVPEEEVERFIRSSERQEAPASGRSAEKGVKPLIRLMRRLKRTIDPADVDLVERYIQEGSQPADWSDPLA